MHFKFICSHLHDAFPLIYINLCNYFCLFTRPLPGSTARTGSPRCATGNYSLLLLCSSLPLSFTAIVCLFVCLAVPLSAIVFASVCVCVCVFIEQVHCPCKIFGSLLLSLLSFDQLDRGVAAKGESETGGLLSYFFIDLTVQSSRQRRHNLSWHCLRHMFDVYKFNLIYLNNYVSFGYEQCKEGKAQHKSKARAKLPSMAGQCRQREGGMRGSRSRSHSY